MTEYIEREKDKYIKLSQALEVLDNCACWWAHERMERVPATNVRPVVTCRDCIHCRKGDASLECEKHTYTWNKMRRWVDEDDFCSWGVKREEADNIGID